MVYIYIHVFEQCWIIVNGDNYNSPLRDKSVVWSASWDLTNEQMDNLMVCGDINQQFLRISLGYNQWSLGNLHYFILFHWPDGLAASILPGVTPRLLPRSLAAFITVICFISLIPRNQKMSYYNRQCDRIYDVLSSFSWW